MADSPANRAIMDQILSREYLHSDAQFHPGEDDTALVNSETLHWESVKVSGGDLDFIKLFSKLLESRLEDAVDYAVAYIDIMACQNPPQDQI